MREAYAASSVTANSGNGRSCTTFPETCTISYQISALLRTLYPRKTWSVVAGLLGLSERAAKYRMSATRPYTIDELQTLLQSEDGQEVIKLLMADSAPKWWVALKKQITLCEARAQQEAARQLVLSMEVNDLDLRDRRRLKRFANADKRLNADAAQAETATGLLVANVGRSVHSAMAQAQGKAQAGIASKGGRR